MIRIGYAGSNTLLPSSSKTFRIANYTEDRMLKTAKTNLRALEAILNWNIQHNIKLFRITSNLIPYGSNPINTGSWQNELAEHFQKIGVIIKQNGLTVSMHPGQYTVLNSPNQQIYEASVRDLEYHNTIFELMELDKAKIVIHCGGGYGNKHRAMDMFVQRFAQLAAAIKARIVLENDERVCNAQDVWELAQPLGIPVVFDIFHHTLLPSFDQLAINEIILKMAQSWRRSRQKVHYSNQSTARGKGAHSESVDITEFKKFYDEVKNLELDVMLEVKDKQSSVLKIRKIFPDLA